MINLSRDLSKRRLDFQQFGFGRFHPSNPVMNQLDTRLIDNTVSELRHSTGAMLRQSVQQNAPTGITRRDDLGIFDAECTLCRRRNHVGFFEGFVAAKLKWRAATTSASMTMGAMQIKIHSSPRFK